MAVLCSSEKNACDRIRARRSELILSPHERVRRTVDAMSIVCQAGEIAFAQTPRAADKASATDTKNAALPSLMCGRLMDLSAAKAEKLAAELTPTSTAKEIEEAANKIKAAFTVPQQACKAEADARYQAVITEICKAKLELLRSVDLWNTKPPPPQAPKARTLDITRATYGDFKNNHTCDATIFLRDKCKLGQQNMQDKIDDSFCFYDRAGSDAAALGTGADLCGYEPSAQAEDKRIKVEFSCKGVPQTPFEAVGETKAIRLFCGSFPPASRPAEPQPNIAEIKVFLTTNDCKVALTP